MTDDVELRNVWQSAPVRDLSRELDRLRRVNRFHRYVNLANFAAGWSLAGFSLVADMAGWIQTGFLLPIMSFTFMTYSVWQYRRDKQRLISSFSLEPRALILFTMGRVRAGLWLARQIYAGVPAALVIGIVLGSPYPFTHGLLVSGAALAVAGAIVAVAAICVFFGLRLASLRRQQLATLTAAMASLPVRTCWRVNDSVSRLFGRSDSLMRPVVRSATSLDISAMASADG